MILNSLCDSLFNSRTVFGELFLHFGIFFLLYLLFRDNTESILDAVTIFYERGIHILVDF